MHLENRSPGLLLKEFFFQRGLVFKQTEERGIDQRFVAGEVYDPQDSRIKKTKRFLFKKFGEDKLQWNHVCSVRSERFYIHRGQVAISSCGESNLPLVKKLAQELKKDLRQECKIELRSDDKIYRDSRQYESEQAVDGKYSDAVFRVRAAAFLVVLLLAAKLLSDFFPLSHLSELLGVPSWEGLALVYWIIRLLMLFFGV